MMRLKKPMTVIALTAMLSANVLLSCNRNTSDSDSDKTEQASDSTKHDGDHPKGEHPQGEHPSDSTKD